VVVRPGEDGADPTGLANELTDARRRGLDDLDVATPPQSRVEVPQLESLARVYAAGEPLARTELIKRLLRDGLTAYDKAGHHDYAAFVKRLFFDDNDEAPGKKRPGDLLKEARDASGLSEDAFDARRRAVFENFATFLPTFVSSATRPAAAKDQAHRSARRRWYWALAALTAVGVVVVLWAATSGNGKRTALRPSSSPSVTTGTSGNSAASSGGRTYTETGGNRHGSPTFTDPLHPTVTGQPVAFLEQVQVSCKVKAATLDSVLPDGYWYKIVSPPWNGNYFGIANTFLNGDTVGQATLHNTDFAVPDCA
jgi:hypothetical protein